MVGEEQMAADSAIALRSVRAVRLDLTLRRFQFWPPHEVMLAVRTTEFKHAPTAGPRTSASRPARQSGRICTDYFVGR